MKKLVFILLFSMSFLAQAEMECGSKGCTGVPTAVLIKPDNTVHIYPYSEQKAIGSPDGPASCTGHDSNRAISMAGNGLNDRAYSMLLMSIASKTPVFIRINDNSSMCEVSYVKYQEGL